MPLSHLSPQDRALFWQFGQGPEVPVPDPLVHHAVERWATAAPHAVAAEHQGTTITYGELDRRPTGSRPDSYGRAYGPATTSASSYAAPSRCSSACSAR